jgi:hypothetical protein
MYLAVFGETRKIFADLLGGWLGLFTIKKNHESKFDICGGRHGVVRGGGRGR